MDTNGAAAEFHAVHDHVIMLAAHFLRVGLEQRDVLGYRRGERMMARIPAVLFAIKPSSGKLDDPKEIKLMRINHQLPLPFQNVGAIQTDFAEDFTGVQPLVGGEENQVAFLDFQF